MLTVTLSACAGSASSEARAQWTFHPPAGWVPTSAPKLFGIWSTSGSLDWVSPDRRSRMAFYGYGSASGNEAASPRFRFLSTWRLCAGLPAHFYAVNIPGGVISGEHLVMRWKQTRAVVNYLYPAGAPDPSAEAAFRTLCPTAIRSAR
jgi:hypothetical protein